MPPIGRDETIIVPRHAPAADASPPGRQGPGVNLVDAFSALRRRRGRRRRDGRGARGWWARRRRCCHCGRADAGQGSRAGRGRRRDRGLQAVVEGAAPERAPPNPWSLRRPCHRRRIRRPLPRRPWSRQGRSLRPAGGAACRRAGHGALDGIDLDVFADAVAQKILHRLTDADRRHRVERASRSPSGWCARRRRIKADAQQAARPLHAQGVPDVRPSRPQAISPAPAIWAELEAVRAPRCPRIASSWTRRPATCSATRIEDEARWNAIARRTSAAGWTRWRR
jgi:hypothetical protein